MCYSVDPLHRTAFVRGRFLFDLHGFLLDKRRWLIDAFIRVLLPTSGLNDGPRALRLAWYGMLL